MGASSGGAAAAAGVGADDAAARFVGERIEEFERQGGRALTRAERTEVFESVARGATSTAAIDRAIRNATG